MLQNISIHTNLIQSIPIEIILPIAQSKGFYIYDISDSYLLKVFKLNYKNYNLCIFENFKNYFDNDSKLNSIKNMLEDLFIKNLSLDKTSYSSQKNSFFNSIFLQDYFSINDDFKFNQSLKMFWKNILELIFKFEFKYIVSNIPAVLIPTQYIESDLNYYHKFLKKFQNRISSIAKLCEDFEIQFLLNLNPLEFIKNNIIYSPFNSFSEFIKYYNKLILEIDNLGLFLDISSFFITEFKKIVFKLIAAQDPNLDLEILGNLNSFEKYLLSNSDISQSIFEPIKNIENLKFIGFNDLKYLFKLQFGFSNAFNDLQIQELLSKLYINANDILLPSFGDLPLKTFFIYLRKLNNQQKLPKLYSLNAVFKPNGFSYDNIDWRNIDLKNLKINPILKESIEGYIKLKIDNLEFLPEDLFEPNLEDIRKLKVISFHEILKILKNYNSILI